MINTLHKVFARSKKGACLRGCLSTYSPLNRTSLLLSSCVALFKGSAATLIFISFAFQACDRDKNNPGYDYFPDMAYSNAYETYAPNPNFPDGKTLQAPVDGTYSREGEYYPYKKTDADMLKAAQLKNPFLPDTVNIARGKVVYQNICLQCHGVNGDGKGHLFVSGKYTYPPANLLDQKIRNLTDGQMFHAITVGFGIMEPHGLIVRPNYRWKTVLYVRSLENKTPTTSSNNKKTTKYHEATN